MSKQQKSIKKFQAKKTFSIMPKPEMKSFKVQEIPRTIQIKTRLFASNELVKNNSHEFFAFVNIMIIITLCVSLQIVVTLFWNNFFPLSRFVLTVEISFR